MNKKKFWISLLAGIMAAIMILGLIIGILPSHAHAKSSADIRNEITELENQKNNLSSQIADLEKQVSANQTEMKDIVNQKAVIEQQVSLLYAQMDNLNQQITAYSVLIADKQAELDDAEARLAELNRKHKERIRTMEEAGKVSYWSILFEARNFSDLLDRLNIIREISDADNRRLQEITEAAKDVENAKAGLQTERASLEASKAELDKAQEQLKEKSKTADALLAQLVAKGEAFDDLIFESEKKQQELMESIAQKESDFDAAKDREYQEWLASQIKPGGDTNTVDGIVWVVPCQYTVVTSPFGMRIHPIHKVPRFHYGVDLAGGSIYGKPIYATRSGKVEIAGWGDAEGNYVEINHGDGWHSIYMHMTHFIVGVGEFVAAGQVIGYVGSTGGSTGPHLHFGIRNHNYTENFGYVNPMIFIGK